MLPEIDIWRAAHLMVQQHKDEAVKVATLRAAELEKAGNAEGRAVWLRIAAAIVELQRMPAEGDVAS